MRWLNELNQTVEMLAKKEDNKPDKLYTSKKAISSTNYWKSNNWPSEAFCGKKDQQANENLIWIEIFNKLIYANA